jgi:outer membrane protein assembly factor BamB
MSLSLVVPPGALALGSVNVLTRNGNNQRTGANLDETTLNTSNVNASQFGKLFQLPVDDQVYSGILYASGVPIAGGSHNVIYVATVNNTVYAFDADTAGPPLWTKNYNGAGRPTNNTEVGGSCGTYRDFSGHIGIVSTPVIDASSSTIYFVTRVVNGGTVQQLRAVDITNGNDRLSPVTIGTINSVTNNQRPALALSNGVIYVAWSSFCDTGPYHGRMLAFNASNLAQVGSFDAVPSGSGAGIWMAGAGPAFDASGNIYVPTGNGTFDANTGGSNFGESMLRLGPQVLDRQDWFTPTDWSSLNGADLDFGGGGPVFIPGTNMFVAGGKGGTGYLINAGNLGHVGGALQTWAAVDTTPRPSATHHLHNAMVTWVSPSGTNVYAWGENDFAHVWRFNTSTQRLNMPAVASGTVLPPQGMPGGMMFISANNSQSGSGILWAATPHFGDANQAVVPGALYALNAETLALLWSSTTGVENDSYNFAKGSPPVVANGKVYVASMSNVVSVYGLRTTPSAQNLARGKTATAPTSTSCATTEGPDKAVNGTVSGGNADKWCTHTAGAFLQVDLGSSMSIGQFIIEHAGAGGEAFNLNTKAYTITTSTDGTNFSSPVVSVSNNIQSITTHNITPVTARFLRLNITTPTQTTDTAARIYEFAAFAPLGTAPPSTIQYEAESLPVAMFTAGRTERVALDAGYSGGQGVILEGHAANDFISFTANVPQARTYDIRVAIKRLGNRGIWQFDSNGTNLGPQVDGFATAASFPEIDLGNMAFSSAGNKTFRFTMTGKNASSTDFWIAIDYIKLIPQ